MLAAQIWLRYRGWCHSEIDFAYTGIVGSEVNLFGKHE
jgi:hypothetical protein